MDEISTGLLVVVVVVVFVFVVVTMNLTESFMYLNLRAYLLLHYILRTITYKSEMN